MRIGLINPGWHKESLWGNKIFRLPPYGLALLAALTPEEHDVKIIDENIEKIDFDSDFDVVGISCMTPLAPRGYEIADNFRQNGTKVILGGIHPSMMPNESIKHADSVIIGEAEDCWQKVLNDNQKGRLKKFYKSHCCALKNLPEPKRLLFKRKKYFTINTLQTTRGCPYGCDFCSVSSFFGKTPRRRSIEQIVSEVEKMDGKLVFFIDDNIVADHNYAKELFEKLVDVNKLWVSQSSISVAKDEKLLKIFADSGCVGLFIGFESLSESCLGEVHKRYSPSEYEKTIKLIHDYGIPIEGAFMFGFDNEDNGVFKKTLDFVWKNEIEGAQFSILTPFPGTKLFESMKEANRITTYDWKLYDTTHLVFKSKYKEKNELERKVLELWAEFYSIKSFLKKFKFLRNKKIKNLLYCFNLWTEFQFGFKDLIKRVHLYRNNILSSSQE